jgi:hypothetical protein
LSFNNKGIKTYGYDIERFEVKESSEHNLTGLYAACMNLSDYAIKEKDRSFSERSFFVAYVIRTSS